MSTVTLETLRADFEAEQALFAYGMDLTIEEWADELPLILAPPETPGRRFGTAWLPLVQLARRYIIHRDAAVAAAILQLSDGAQDPREGGGA